MLRPRFWLPLLVSLFFILQDRLSSLPSSSWTHHSQSLEWYPRITNRRRRRHEPPDYEHFQQLPTASVASFLAGSIPTHVPALDIIRGIWRTFGLITLVSCSTLCADSPLYVRIIPHHNDLLKGGKLPKIIEPFLQRLNKMRWGRVILHMESSSASASAESRLLIGSFIMKWDNDVILGACFPYTG